MTGISPSSPKRTGDRQIVDALNEGKRTVRERCSFVPRRIHGTLRWSALCKIENIDA